MKKALSVFLSLLMVITSISVVFTLPASAATSYVVNENFDSMAAGNLDARREFEGADGWLRVGANAAVANIVDLSVSSVDYNNCTAASGSNILTINSWSNAGYVFAVEPNTTYTLTFKWYTVADTRDGNYARPQVSVNDVSALTGNIAGAHRGTVTDANSGSSSAVATKTESWTCGTTSPAWKEITLSFTTAATSTKYLVSFTHENNDNSGVTAAQKALYIDDFAISYEAKPGVKAETYGAATQNGGVAWIDTDISGEVAEGTAITYKAMPYDSSLFDGWYVDGVKVSEETTLTRNWAISEKVVAKFEALSENIWPDVENRTTFNKAGDKWAGNAKFPWYGGGLKTHVTVDQTLLTTGSSYGLSGLIKDDNVYSGKLSYTLPSAGSHFASQIVKVKPSTEYTLTFWYYATTAITVADTYAYDLDKAYHIYYAEDGLGFASKEDARIIYTNGDNLKDYTDESGNVIQKKITHTASNTSTLNEWTKATVTFTSDAELPYVIISLKSSSAYIDHVTLCETPKATTPTVTVSDNGMNAGFIQSVSDVYYEGDTFTATAVGYDNGTFLGWYVNDQKVSESLTYVFTYDSDATYVAKFDALTPNIFEDGSFEGYTATPSKLPTSGQSASSTGMFVWGVWNGTTQTPTAKGWVGTQYGRGYVASASAVNEIATGAAPYAGNNVAVGYTGSHAIAKVVPVEQNKTYKLVYYTYSLSANALATDKKTVIGVDMTSGTVANGAMTFSTDGTNNQTALTTTYTSFDNQTTGAWVRQEATFNSGDYTNVLVQFGVGASQGLMIDHISVFEIPTAFAPTITIDDGGKNAGIVYDVTKVYKDGEEFSASAKAYANGEFLGWYVGDVLASENETVTLTYDSTKTYTAKFSALKANIWQEETTVSSTTALYKGTGLTSPKAIGANNWTGQSWATIYNVDNAYIATLASGLKAYAGDTALYFSSHNGHQAYKVVRGLKTNTDYTLGYWIYTNNTDPTTSDLIYNDTTNYGFTGIATDATMIEVEDMYVKIGTAAATYPQVRPTQSVVTKNIVANEWCYIERTFNTGSNTDFLVNFGNNSSTIVMYDHIALFETPVFVTPTVTVDDGGKNAGIVYNVTGGYFVGGEEFTATTMPYENGTFVGFYTDDVKLADEKVTNNADGSYTATFTYTEGAVYSVKYTAEKPNLLVDGSHENATAVAPNTSVNNSNVATQTATVETPIGANGWVAGRYGGAFIVKGSSDYLYGSDAIPTTPAAFSGNNLLMMNTGWHHIGKVVTGLETNTDYVYTAWVYVTDDKGYNTYNTSTYKVIGLSDEQYATGNVLKSSATAGDFAQTTALATTKTYTHQANTWVKYTAKFNTGSYTKVILPYFTQTTRAAYVDHESLVAQSAPMTVVVDNTKGYLVVDDAYAESTTVPAGQTANVTLKTYAGSVFQGWYEDPTFTGEAVSTDPSLNVTATEGATLYAKFVSSNIIADPGFENMPYDLEGKEDQYGWYTEVQSGYGGDTWPTITIESSSAGITPYSGNKMFRLNHRNNDGAIRRLTGLKKNTVYTISFMANMENDHAAGDCFLEAVAVTDLDVLSVSRYGGDETTYTPYSFKPHSHKYQLAETVATHDDWAWTTPEWKRVTLTFNSGNLEEANLLISFTSEAGAMLIDEFTIQESISSTVSVETLNPFKESTLGIVGGRAEIVPNTEYSIYAGVEGTAKATLKAIPFNNSVFLGWYVGETLVSTNATAEVEFTEAKNYVAKFASFGFDEGTPVYVDGVYGAGFENATKSENFVVLSSTYAKPTTTVIGDKTYYIPTYEDGKVWTSSNKDEYGQIGVTKEMAFEGDYSLVVRDGAKGESVFNKITGLTENTDYTVSFWYYIPEATLLETGLPANYIHYVAVDPVDAPTHASGLPADNTGALYFDWYQSNTSYGEWTKITVSFNSGANTEVALNIGYVCSGSVDRTDNQPQDITNLYIDNLAVYARADLNTAAQNAFEISAERGGIAIRVANPETGVSQALRFKARIAKERLTAMTLGADYTIVEYGTLAMNAAYIEGNTALDKANNLTLTLDAEGNKVPYTFGGKTANVGVTYNADSGANKVFGYKDGENDLIFTAALTGIGKNKTGQDLADAYRTEFIVRTYAIVELADGSRIVVLDNNDSNYSASVLDVADAAIKAHELGTTILDEATLDCVNAISAVCESYPEATPENGVASSHTVLYDPTKLADGSVIENYFIDARISITGDKGTHTNSRPKYYDSDKSIRMYAGNTLTLTAAEGYYIESVVIGTLEDYPYGNATTSTGVATTEGLATTVTGINSSTFTLTTPAATRITSILVNYKYGTAPDPIYPEEPEDPEEPVDENVTEVTPADLGLANAAAIENVETGSVVLNGSQGTHSNSVPAFYSSDNTIRAYEGNTLTLTTTAASTFSLRSVTAAKNIKSVVITFKSNYADENLGVSVGTKSELVDNVLTISDVNTREIVLTFTKTTRILSITINTEDITPCETHTYASDCDVDCDVCGAVRDDAPHAFVSDCDTTCECGATREALADHTADACASTCEVCGEAVVPTHKFAGDCDTTCECGETREATADHTYVDGACSVCGAIEPVSCAHEYDNNCDAECNICGFVRDDITHTYVSDCDTKCEYCDETREALAEHSYEFVCSTECSLCGATREADHDFSNGDCECGEPVPTTTTVNTNIGEYATANGWTDSTKYTEIVNGKVTITANGGGNTGKYYTNGNNWRIYQGESGTVTISVAPGYTLVSVKVTYTSSNSGVLTFNGDQLPSGEVLLVNGASVTLAVGNTGTASNGQARITDIEVIYDVVAPCETHTYSSDCDVECDVCGTVRDDAPHAFVSDCDTTCDCGLVRETSTEHTTDDACKTACDLCGEAVVPTHKWAGDCDTTCECGETREALADHTYTDNCDADCNVCGAIREEVPHVWTDGYDAECDNCGETRIPPLSCEHTNADACDTNCPDCDATLTPTHKWAGDCDTTCDCGETREALADHAYTDNCDADCNNCGAIRTVTHDDAVLCDTTCSNCGATVEATAEHNYVDGACDACGAEKPTSTQVSIGAIDMGIANGVAMDTYTSGLVTLVGDQGTNSSGNVPKYYTSGGNTIRIYAGNTITISVPDGYIIEVIALVCSDGYLATSEMGSNYTTTDGTVVTFDQIGASTWVLTNTGSAQVRIAEFMVIYKEVIVCDHEYDNNCDAECNLCGETREVTHADDVLCDEICSNCGAEVVATEDHVYDDDNDAICNNCGFERILASECTHEYDNNCDADCNLCDFVREVGDHVYDDDCDANCNECNAEREVTHADDVLCDETCSNCGAEVVATAEHNYVDGVCSNCNAEEPSEQTLAQFTMGANGDATHYDGSSATTYSETVSGYTLSITGGTKMYSSARDAMGNSCLKLGTGSVAGGFTFTVAENVTKVIIYIGGYKATAGKLTINGTSYTTTNNSNDGAYDAIEIDTSTTKTVTLTTISGGYRAMVNGIDFVGTPA